MLEIQGLWMMHVCIFPQFNPTMASYMDLMLLQAKIKMIRVMTFFKVQWEEHPLID